MIIRNTVELPADNSGTVYFLGTLYINVKRDKWQTEHGFVCSLPSEAAVKEKMNRELLAWMKDKLDKYCNQREGAFQHAGSTLTNDQISALYHIRAKVLKSTTLFEFSQAFGYNWSYIESLLPKEDSRFANWRTIIKQIWHTCQREVFKSVPQSNP